MLIQLPDYILENNHTKINYPNTKSTILGNKETINFTSLFEKCEELRDVNNFDFLKNCKNEVILDNMFKNCSNLLNVNFSALNNNISSINGIFSDCINLQKISAQYWSEHFFEKTEKFLIKKDVIEILYVFLKHVNLKLF